MRCHRALVERLNLQRVGDILRYTEEDLLAMPNVSNVKTSLVIRSDKNEPGVPFEMSDHLAAENV